MMLFALAHRNHTSMRHFAFDVLELDGGMVNSEVAVQAFFNIAQNPLAH